MAVGIEPGDPGILAGLSSQVMIPALIDIFRYLEWLVLAVKLDSGHSNLFLSKRGPMTSVRACFIRSTETDGGFTTDY